MRSTTASVATLFAMASFVAAQDANCSAILLDYAPNSNGKFQKCYTEQRLIHEVCDAKTAGCDQSALLSGINKYLGVCSASIDAEAVYGNVLQLGKNALEIFFAYPIHEAYCTADPNAKSTSAILPPVVAPKIYCLESSVQDPSSRFVSNLAVYLTSGTIRSAQLPFFIANNLPKEDVCSPCSQTAVKGTIEHLADNLMPRIAPFYTPEFVQYWTKFVPAYNTLCGTKFTQQWPVGTLNITTPNIPTGSPSTPATTLPTSTSPSTKEPKPNGALNIKPAAGVATAILMAAVALL
ncbi:hypothetical protein BGZ65_009646 [Modicella reniformis]|uniref:Uncharacterized protein n=1 Tax=Modicella reniformis TaxID=1440133 RepID=A0A9P6MAW2_9FUNG|nr:hypothetical protein BGZ65_009646 [Modicella reniformis]